MSLRPVIFDEYCYCQKGKTREGEWTEILGMMLYGRPPPGTKSKKFGFDQRVHFTWSLLARALQGQEPFVNPEVHEDQESFIKSTNNERAAKMKSWEDQALIAAKDAYTKFFDYEKSECGDNSVVKKLEELRKEADAKGLKFSLLMLLRYHSEHDSRLTSAARSPKKPPPPTNAFSVLINQRKPAKLSTLENPPPLKPVSAEAPITIEDNGEEEAYKAEAAREKTAEQESDDESDKKEDEEMNEADEQAEEEPAFTKGTPEAEDDQENDSAKDKEAQDEDEDEEMTESDED
ncbi:hypothetical protein KEM56_003287 [Ascosphaera pollenicola]|nr:hypothetical protein KEM56_003287 [Ascosphaera pollenicola]